MKSILDRSKHRDNCSYRLPRSIQTFPSVVLARHRVSSLIIWDSLRDSVLFAVRFIRVSLQMQVLRKSHSVTVFLPRFSASMSIERGHSKRAMIWWGNLLNDKKLSRLTASHFLRSVFSLREPRLMVPGFFHSREELSLVCVQQYHASVHSQMDWSFLHSML